MSTFAAVAAPFACCAPMFILLIHERRHARTSRKEHQS